LSYILFISFQVDVVLYKPVLICTHSANLCICAILVNRARKYVS